MVEHLPMYYQDENHKAVDRAWCAQYTALWT